jgi:PAS domain S-box-containing protein/putative nucleotidyltransferase with HDIG domain
MIKNDKTEIKEIKDLSEKIQKIISKEKLFNNLLSLSNDGVALDYKGYIIYCNEKYAEILGYKKEELIGKNILILFTPHPENLLVKRIEERDGESEIVCKKKDGREIYVKIKVKNVNFEGKKLKFITLRNITDEKLVVEEIKDSREKYKVLTETLLDGIIVIDLKGNILFSNLVGANLLGFEKVKDIIGKNIFKFVKERDLLKNELKLIYENKGGYLIEYEIKDAKGSKFVIESIGQRFKFDGQDAFLLCFRDITERKLIIDNLKNSIEKQKTILLQSVNTISEIMAFRDPYTAKHQKSVAKLAVKIAYEMGFSKNLIEGIRIASLLHDIGKVYIPTDILLKPGKLNGIEWEFIKMHPIYGANIVKNIQFPWDVKKIILQHHERIDGSGYPNGLKSEEIIIETKILSVADVVEAMTSYRPYRTKFSLNEALEEIKKFKGLLYDKEVVETCLTVFKKGFTFENAEEGI